MIPIYRTYYYTEGPIGFLAMEENKLKFRFKEAISRDKMFDIFGNAGIHVTEYKLNADKEMLIVAGEILHYAYMAG